MEYISEEGLLKLKSELEQMKTEKRKEIAMRLEHAKSLGDLSENAEYQEAKEAQSLLESQISELEDRIKNATIISKDRIGDRVEVGSTVKVKSSRGEEVYTIVGSEEANPIEGKISNESPMGRSFLGKRTGDKVSVKTPSGEIQYQIISIK